MIPVTKSFLPPIEEYMAHVQRAYNNEWLTNRGELVLELEDKLKSYLGVSNILITNNGTIPLQIALKLLGGGGEIITTPFSYVATTAAIVWENCTPVFVDIHPEYLTIDETLIEAAITPKTTCILATHVFGNPCNVEEIGRIAKKYNLKVIYDAAHCFGVKYQGKSIFEYGDISTCSFHATKLFHTGEGGAIFCKDEDLRHEIYYSHNFGHNGPTDFLGLGINGKISELQAAMGLSVLPYMEELVAARMKIVQAYMGSVPTVFQSLKIREGTEWNFSYFPLIFQNENELLRIQCNLNNCQIFPRRYFYPSLNNIQYLPNSSMPISESIAKRIMCLPVFYGLSDIQTKNILNLLQN
jgi:dTDP-4-amino-4,6-dideoxygalactose transaminase